jgi:uncharacterized damage-inducible protein DinB
MEAWLAGPIEGIDAYLMPAAHAFVQARTELEAAVTGLTPEQLWASPGGAASVGFHLRHVAGATDRLLTYARAGALSEAQLAVAKAEKEPAPELDVARLLADLATAIDAALAQLRGTPRESLLDGREVGRAKLPVTVLGLLFHAADHAQRHAGQAIATAKLARIVHEAEGTPSE